jgi:hypothetical protein
MTRAMRNEDERGQAVLEAQVVERMKTLVASRTRASLNERFGISYNTWRKVMDGLPLRSSLAARLRERVRRLEESSSNS